MTRILRPLLAALLAVLLAFPVAAQPVDQETYEAMVQPRDQVADALDQVHSEQQKLSDQYRSPDWVIHGSGDRVLTLHRDDVVARISSLGLVSGTPASWPLVLIALKRSDPDLYEVLNAIQEPIQSALVFADTSEIFKAFDAYVEGSSVERKVAFEKKEKQLEKQRKDLQELLDFMDAELRTIKQEMDDASDPAEPDPASCEPDGDNALDALCADLDDETDDETDQDPPVEAFDLWDGCWATLWGQLRLDEAIPNVEGRLAWEDDDGEKHEIVHTYQPLTSGYPDRLVGDFYGPLPGYEFACPEPQAGREQWGTVRMDYESSQGQSFHASYLPCADYDNHDFIQLDGTWDQTLEVCDAAPDPETERWIGTWESNLGTLHIGPSGSGLAGLLESEVGTAKLEITTAGPQVLQGSFVGPIDGPWLPESIVDRAPAGVCPTERAGEESWGEFHLYYSEGNDYWQDVNDPRDDEFGGFWNPCDQAWREEVYSGSGFGHEFYGWRPDPNEAD